MRGTKAKMIRRIAARLLREGKTAPSAFVPGCAEASPYRRMVKYCKRVGRKP
jgi:hypothetical protein